MKKMTLVTIKGFEFHGRATCKAAFLARMETLVPWAPFCALIEPHYPKVGNGRPPVGLERMLRMYLVANWFSQANKACEDALYGIPAFCDFSFRHLLEGRQIGAALFAKVGELLQSNGMMLSGGTIVAAPLIAAPPSTKNREQARDPEMCQSKKGSQWHFGMKVHIEVSSQELPNLLHGDETQLYGDSAYRAQNQQKLLTTIAPNARDFTNKRAYRNRPLTDTDRETNRKKSSVRPKIEHPFLRLKHLWDFTKARYRGLAKNANRAFAMFALINLTKWGIPLIGQVRPA